MDSTIIEWPVCVLRPRAVEHVLVPFTRGATSLGGVGSFIRTDLGFWEIGYQGIIMPVNNRNAWKSWQAIRSFLGGRSGLIAVRVKASLSAPFASGEFEPVERLTHSDGASFSDGSLYANFAISIKMDQDVAIGATSVTLRVIAGSDSLAGTRFSFEHALYEIGRIRANPSPGVYTVDISPSIRAPIPAESELNFDRPTCLCHLADDKGMVLRQDTTGKFGDQQVLFNEATDYWNALALGEI